MFFILDETDVLHVAKDEAALQGAFEGVDVESGNYQFFDAAGAPLEAQFTIPNRRGKSLGLFDWVWSGTYRLVPGPIVRPHLSEILGSAHSLAVNPYFPDIEALKLSLQR